MPDLHPSVNAMVTVDVGSPSARPGSEPTEVSVTVSGDMDLDTEARVVAGLESVLAQGHRTVRLDLSGVTFLDCAGLGVLIRMHQRFQTLGGSLVLTRVSRPAARLIWMAELHDVLSLAPGTQTPRDVACTPASAAGPRP